MTQSAEATVKPSKQNRKDIVAALHGTRRRVVLTGSYMTQVVDDRRYNGDGPVRVVVKDIRTGAREGVQLLFDRYSTGAMWLRELDLDTCDNGWAGEPLPETL